MKEYEDMENGCKTSPDKPIIQFKVDRTDGNSKHPVGFELVYKGYTDSNGVLKIALTRTGNLVGRVSPAISIDRQDTKTPDWISFTYSHADDFEAGRVTAYAYVDYEVSEENFTSAQHMADDLCRFILVIDPSSQYDIGPNRRFSLDFRMPRE